MTTRRDILWLGETGTDAFKAECRSRANRGLTEVSWDSWRDYSPTACAIVIEIPCDGRPFRDRARRLVQGALHHGLRIGLVAPINSVELTPDQYEAVYRIAAELQIESERIKVALQGRDKILGWLNGMQPTRGLNPSLEALGPSAIEDSDWTLFQRAFSDAAGLYVEELDGGKSGAQVYKVRPVDDSGTEKRPLIVKRQSLEKMRLEFSNYHWVKENIPVQLHAPLLSDRSVEGHATGLSVYEFVGDAIPLVTALQSGNPGRIVTQLFRGAFSQSIRGSGRSLTPVGRLLDDGGQLRFVRWSPTLTEAANAGRTLDATVEAPSNLREVLRSLPPVECRVGMVHGDLHSGNVLYSRAIEAAVPIDYGRVTSEAPLVVDPALLEVSLTFPVDGHGKLLTMVDGSVAFEDWLREAYRPPLRIDWPARDAYRLAWLGEALSAIRIEAMSMESDKRAYGISVACALLRVASYEDHGDAKLRSLAYVLGAKLIAHLERA